VGIYLGNGKMIDSPRTGTVVTVRSVYSANAVFTRV
jgi:cell wall-associated NlpC family hydrolase